MTLQTLPLAISVAIKSVLQVFDLHQIVVFHDEAISQKKILLGAGVRVGDNILTRLSVHQIKKNIETTCHEVKKAEVQLRLPGTITIRVVMRIPQIVWRHEGQFFLLDEDGYKIRSNINKEEKTKYVILFGDDADKSFKEVLQALYKYEVTRSIASLYYINKRRWDVFLSDGKLIRLPENNQQIALQLLDHISQSQPELLEGVKIIDLRLAPRRIFIKN